MIEQEPRRNNWSDHPTVIAIGIAAAVIAIVVFATGKSSLPALLGYGPSSESSDPVSLPNDRSIQQTEAPPDRVSPTSLAQTSKAESQPAEETDKPTVTPSRRIAPTSGGKLIIKTTILGIDVGPDTFRSSSEINFRASVLDDNGQVKTSCYMSFKLYREGDPEPIEAFSDNNCEGNYRCTWYLKPGQYRLVTKVTRDNGYEQEKAHPFNTV